MQLACLSEAIYFEARGESLAGQAAVGLTIMNRALDEGTVCDVVRRPGQFTYQPTEVCDLDRWVKIVALADQIFTGKVFDFTDGATHYYAPKKVKRVPKWAGVLKFVGSIGNHRFYKEPS